MVKKDTKPKEKAETPKKAEAPKKETGFFVYLGPSIRGVIQTATIFNGTRKEVEEFLAGPIERYPRIKRLLVSGDTLAEDRIKVKTPGNGLYVAYGKLVDELKNKEG